MSRLQHAKLCKHYMSRYRVENFKHARDYHAMWKKMYYHFKRSGMAYIPSYVLNQD